MLTPYNTTPKTNVSLLPTLSAKYPPIRAPHTPPTICDPKRTKNKEEAIVDEIAMFFDSVTFSSENITQGNLG